MNIQDYISSGVVESYVLGLVSEQEKMEFERLCLQYSELVAARDEFELALEKQCLTESVSPSLGIRTEVLQAMQQLPSINKPKIVAMESSNNKRGSSAKFVAAAAIVLLLVSAYFAYSFYNENKKLKAGGADPTALNTQEDSLRKRVQALEEEQKIMSDPNVAVVNLKPVEKAPRSAVNVYWDSTSANVYLVVKNMPKLPSEKQYQLWALIGGQPKNLGLFDVGDDGKVLLRKMEDTNKADAFAITVENKGNTGGPNLEQLQTMGKTIL